MYLLVWTHVVCWSLPLPCFSVLCFVLRMFLSSCWFTLVACKSGSQRHLNHHSTQVLKLCIGAAASSGTIFRVNFHPALLFTRRILLATLTLAYLVTGRSSFVDGIFMDTSTRRWSCCQEDIRFSLMIMQPRHSEIANVIFSSIRTAGHTVLDAIIVSDLGIQLHVARHHCGNGL
jgi:hypothetical protein